MSYLVHVPQWVIVVVFGTAASTKLLGKAALSEFVRNAERLVPTRWRPQKKRIAGLVIAGEIAVVVLLVIPQTRTTGFILAGVLSALFAAALHRALRAGNREPCRCFGASTERLSNHSTYRNVILFMVAGVGLAANASSPEVAATPADLVYPAIAGLVGGILIIRLEQIAFLFSSATPARR